ncbi:MAG: alpha/beta fold hydrolase [Gemmobacter sp.]
MGLTTLTLPRLGETMEEAKVTDWLVAPGAAFARGDVLLEVETDKTVVEVPALAAGVMQAHLVGPGDVVEIGQPIAEVETGSAEAAAPQAARPELGAAPAPVAAPSPAQAHAGPRLRASPLARRQARNLGLDLHGIPGTGRRGRITGADVAAAKSAGRLGGLGQGKDSGEGTVVLLHGLFSSSSGFGGLPERLARAGVQVLAPDLPGHGASPAAEDLAGIEATLAGVIDSQADGPLILVGHSMGAILATRLARRYGERVERLVLLAPAGLGPRINQTFLDILCHAETIAALRRGLGLLGGGPVSDAVLAQELAVLIANRPSHYALARELAAGGVQQIDIAPDLEAVTAPIRALFGTADQVLDWQDCARLPARAAIHLRAGAGHMPHPGADALVEDLILG